MDGMINLREKISILEEFELLDSIFLLNSAKDLDSNIQEEDATSNKQTRLLIEANKVTDIICLIVLD